MEQRGGEIFKAGRVEATRRILRITDGHCDRGIRIPLIQAMSAALRFRTCMMLPTENDTQGHHDTDRSAAVLRVRYEASRSKRRGGLKQARPVCGPAFVDRWIDAVMPHAVANDSFNAKPQASATRQGRCRLRLAVKR